jgi:LmbE family N-acetylglucosaminyl deacetylase
MTDSLVDPLNAAFLSPRILTVYAHPDDESFGPASVLAKYARRGAVIHGVFATRGEQGEPLEGLRASGPTLALLREEDLRDAVAVIGYAGIELLGYEDGTLSDVPEEQIEALIVAAINRYLPEIVITFGPAGITGHPDHQVISRVTTSAFHRARQEGVALRELYYDAVRPERARQFDLEGLPDGQPNTWIDVSSTSAVKLEALRFHARHIKDAQERSERLAEEPETVATLYRAWPEVPPGLRLTGLLTGDQD